HPRCPNHNRERRIPPLGAPRDLLSAAACRPNLPRPFCPDSCIAGCSRRSELRQQVISHIRKDFQERRDKADNFGVSSEPPFSFQTFRMPAFAIIVHAAFLRVLAGFAAVITY